MLKARNGYTSPETEVLDVMLEERTLSPNAGNVGEGGLYDEEPND